VRTVTGTAVLLGSELTGIGLQEFVRKS